MTDQISRDVLPIPDRAFEGTLPYDAKDPDASFPAIESLKPPAGAPNVLVVLLDDVGFAASSAFGGPCATPTAERLAGSGLKYNRFHTTALCAPTRAALLTGRNHHSVGMGVITELATAAPGTTRFAPIPARRWRKRCCSTAIRRPNSASATRCRSGRRARWARSMPGRPAAGASSTSTASSAARRTSTTRRSTKGRTRSNPRRPQKRGTTSQKT